MGLTAARLWQSEVIITCHAAYLQGSPALFCEFLTHLELLYCVLLRQWRYDDAFVLFLQLMLEMSEVSEAPDDF